MEQKAFCMGDLDAMVGRKGRFHTESTYLIYSVNYRSKEL